MRHLTLPHCAVLAIVLVGLLAAPSLLSIAPSTAQADIRYFPQTRHTLRGLFRQYWESHGGLAPQGYPLTEEFSETSPLDGKTYTVQYFQRAIFERHPENAGTPYEVLLAQLGTFRYHAQYPTGALNQQPSEAGTYYPQTGHTLGGKFRDYWQSHGGLAQHGYPLSDGFDEVSPLNGKQYRVQYFERGVFELHPENAPPYDVLLAQLGTFELERRYPNGSNPAAAAIPDPGGAHPAPPGPPPTPVPPTPSPYGYTATAAVSAPGAARGQEETVIGRLLHDGQPVAGATMHTIWQYQAVTEHCDTGVTDTTGTARCSRPVGDAPSGYQVLLTVTFLDRDGAVRVTTEASFTEQ